MSLVRLGNRGEVEVHKVRREEGLVRPKKGQDAVNFASEESFSIVETRQGGQKVDALYGDTTRVATICRSGIMNWKHPIGCA